MEEKLFEEQTLDVNQKGQEEVTTPKTVEEKCEQASSQVDDTNVSLGKFKDVNALIHAYNSLQSEFTKRCQRIKELEGEIQSVDKVTAPTEKVSVEEVKTPTGITDKDKEQILKDYLKGVVASKQKAILIDGVGVGVKTPNNRPKTIAEAGALAKEILTTKN